MLIIILIFSDRNQRNLEQTRERKQNDQALDQQPSDRTTQTRGRGRGVPRNLKSSRKTAADFEKERQLARQKKAEQEAKKKEEVEEEEEIYEGKLITYCKK